MFGVCLVLICCLLCFGLLVCLLICLVVDYFVWLFWFGLLSVFFGLVWFVLGLGWCEVVVV